MAKRATGGRPAPKRTPRGDTGLAAPTRPKTPADTFTSKPVDISFAGGEHRYARIDLQIEGIHHGEASYEGRVFFDNESASAKTAQIPTEGYAGSFYIFGHGGCVGDAGHCDAKRSRRDASDLRYPHPLTAASKAVDVTDTLRTIASAKSKAVITIVPVVSAANKLCDTKNVFKCDGMRLVSYNG